MENLPVIIIAASLCAAALAAFLSLRRRRHRRKLITRIRKAWGQAPSRSYDKGELDSISSYFAGSREGRSTPSIDDITWNDLDMDSVYMSVNGAYTTVGDEYLYYILRQPVFDTEALNKRQALIKSISDNPDQREKLLVILAGLGRNKFAELSGYFLTNEKMRFVKGLYYRLLCLAFLLSPLLLVVNPALGMMAIIATMFLNMSVYYRAKNELDSRLESLSYAVNLIISGRRLARLDLTFAGEELSALRKALEHMKSFSLDSFYSFFYQSGDPFMEYIKIVLLGELIAYESLQNLIYRHREELRTIYETVGLLDSLSAIASWRKSLAGYCIPSFGDSPSRLPYIRAVDIRHPLLKSPVPNTFEFTKPVLLTGSNASGKSTFLKTVAVNAIFAQSIGTCLAREYASPLFAVYTSMALKDSLVNNESYFIAEIKSLKRIFTGTAADLPCLCLIDEVLRGTNTVERIAASSEVLYSLACENTLLIAATHDIELTSVLEGVFENYHFRETLTDIDIAFDYKLYSGRSETRNAIKLLSYMGYNERIVRRAQERAAYFMEKKSWKAIDG